MTSPGTRERDDFDDESDSGLPPHRPHQYTVEGYLLGMGDFASGAIAATGWRRRMAVVVAWAVLIPMGLGVVVGILRLLQLLLFP